MEHLRSDLDQVDFRNLSVAIRGVGYFAKAYHKYLKTEDIKTLLDNLVQLSSWFYSQYAFVSECFFFLNGLILSNSNQGEFRSRTTHGPSSFLHPRLQPICKISRYNTHTIYENHTLISGRFRGKLHQAFDICEATRHNRCTKSLDDFLLQRRRCSSKLSQRIM